MMPHIGLHLVPEKTDLGPDAKIADAGTRIDLIRFETGMASGETAVGIAIPLAGLDLERFAAEAGDNPWVIVQTSLKALRTAVGALEARDQADRGLS